MSSSEIAVVKPNAAQAFNHDEVQLLKSTIMPGATDAELSLFGKVCAQTGLSPFARQIFPVARDVYDPALRTKVKKWSFQTSVDGFRLVAQRSGEYEGQTSAQWCGEDGVWKDVWFSQEPPRAARVGVYRKNFREPLYAIAVWESYVQTYEKNGKTEVGTMWRKMPELMIAKCAECLALRKAFPQELSGLYSAEEMGQADKEPEKESDREGSRESSAPSGVAEKTHKTLPSPIKTESTGRLNPDTHITTGKWKLGEPLSSLSTAELNQWSSTAKTYLESVKVDPDKSTGEMARTYRAMMFRMAELAAEPKSLFEQGSTSVAGIDSDVP